MRGRMGTEDLTATELGAFLAGLVNLKDLSDYRRGAYRREFESCGGSRPYLGGFFVGDRVNGTNSCLRWNLVRRDAI